MSEGRIPSVMARNHENFNPSDSLEEKTTLPRRRVLKAGVIATAAALIGACSAKKAPEAKQTTSAPTKSIGTEPEKPTESPTPETQEIKMIDFSKDYVV